MMRERKKKESDLRKRLHEVPHKPGVYLMRDHRNRIIYVGKAKDLRKRLSHYFAPSRREKADPKTRSLIQSIWDFEVHVVRSDAEAILLETKLIKEYRPKYNVMFRDDKRLKMLKIQLADPFPRLQTTRLRKNDGARYYGPFVDAGALKTTIEWLNKEFGLRSCLPKVPGDKEYKHCHADIIRSCSAPCVAKVSQEEYRERIEKTCLFLEGQAKERLNELEEEMRNAAAKTDFERAAQLRDVIHDLRVTLHPARRFQKGGALSGVNKEENGQHLQELADYLGLKKSPDVIECFDISNISQTYSVASMVRFRDGVPERRSYRRYRMNTVEGQDDFASMAEVVRRRYTRLLAGKERGSIQLPHLVMVDGGKGQVNAALTELKKLGLEEMPVMGLAKEHEEIYLPKKSEPLVIPHEKGALRLLQRIRDEAHRVANGYHQILLKKRMAESILDECPGVSQKRKEQLLRQFGSVERLRKSSAEKIAEIKGISPKLAQDILHFLKKKPIV